MKFTWKTVNRSNLYFHRKVSHKSLSHFIMIIHNAHQLRFFKKSFSRIQIVLMRLFLYSAASAMHIADSQSFLFTLVNPSGNEPVKITPNINAGIRCGSNLGPTFGTTQYNDLLVWSNVNPWPRAGHLVLGCGFKCPENVNKKRFFTGANPFSISELEVFKVNL